MFRVRFFFVRALALFYVLSFFAFCVCGVVLGPFSTKRKMNNL